MPGFRRRRSSNRNAHSIILTLCLALHLAEMLTISEHLWNEFPRILNRFGLRGYVQWQLEIPEAVGVFGVLNASKCQVALIAHPAGLGVEQTFSR